MIDVARERDAVCLERFTSCIQLIAAFLFVCGWNAPLAWAQSPIQDRFNYAEAL
jgi:hypothetical protein